ANSGAVPQRDDSPTRMKAPARPWRPDERLPAARSGATRRASVPTLTLGSGSAIYGSQRSAAARIRAVDLTAKQAAAHRAEDRAKRLVAAAGHFVADQAADGRAYEKAGGAVILAAVVAAVIAAPDASVAMNAVAAIMAVPRITAIPRVAAIVTPFVAVAAVIQLLLRRNRMRSFRHRRWYLIRRNRRCHGRRTKGRGRENDCFQAPDHSVSPFSPPC